MIQYLTEEEKKNCRSLWEEAFPEDSREFGDYYFQEKIKNNRILALTEENEGLRMQEADGRESEVLLGRVEAMLHQNPYRLMVRGQQWKVDYLVGVATRKDKRHRGYMRLLLTCMMAHMRQERMPFCFLMPADEAIYRPFGFTFIYRQPWFEWKDGTQRLSLQRLVPCEDSSGESCNLAAAAEWMNHWLKKYFEVYAVRDEAYLQQLARELISENGTLDVFYDQGEIVAMESWWGREKRERRLLYGDPPYVRRSDEEEKPAIMARIITPEEMVRVIRLKDLQDRDYEKFKDLSWENKEEGAVTDIPGIYGGRNSAEENFRRRRERNLCILLRLKDPLIAENDGLWLWHLNRDTSWMERSEQSRPADLTLTTEELTAWLFGYQVPEAAGKFACLIDTLSGVFLDEIV